MDETTSNSLLHMQLCVSCQQDKAIVICSACTNVNESTSTTTTTRNRNFIPLNDDQVVIASSTTTSTTTTVVEHTNELTESPQQPNTTIITRSISELMRNGNLVYCNECFLAVHKQSANTHVAINIFQNETCLDVDDELLNNQTREIADNSINKPPEEEEEDDQESKPEETLDDKQTKLNNEQLIKRIGEQLVNLNKRCEQFNDVKQSIRQMNDLIKEDLYADVGSIAILLKKKLDELSDKIKEKLKDAYSVVRDTQNRLTNKLNQLGEAMMELEQEQSERMTPSDLLNVLKANMEQIEQINDELRNVCESSAQSPTNTCSLFVDNNLYPQFNYFIDTSKLVEAINDLSIQIGLMTNVDSHIHIQSVQNFNLFTLDKNQLYDCSISSGLTNDGTFWLQLFANETLNSNQQMDLSPRNKNAKHLQKRNLFLEELSKSVRRKRIGDSEWQTYAEAGREPVLNEKCFYLEPITRKWMRARVNSFDKDKQLWRVRLMDTGHLEHVNSTDNLLTWREDIELARLPPRSIKAVLHKHKLSSRSASHSDLVPDSVEPQMDINDYERNICVQTRFFFKDITHNKQLRCSLIDRLDVGLDKNNNEQSLIGIHCCGEEEESTWMIRLYLDESNEKTSKFKSNDINNNNNNKYSVCLNDEIIEFNTKENMLLTNGPNSTFKSSDIRLEYQTQYEDSLNPKPKSIETELGVHKKEVVNSNCASFTVEDHTQRTKEEANYLVNILTPSYLPDSCELKIADQPHFLSSNSQSLQHQVVSHHEPSQLASKSIEHQASENDANETELDESGEDDQTIICKEGQCFVTSSLSQEGLFWIRPFLHQQIHDKYESLSQQIGDFIAKTHCKSYGDLQMQPEANKRCFIKYTNQKKESNWFRGLIESVNQSSLSCYVRFLDRGFVRELSFYDIYPHRRMADIANANFRMAHLAIRCCLSPDSSTQIDQMHMKKFNNLTYPALLNYTLVEQVTWQECKCWYAELRNNDGLINDKVVSASETLRRVSSNRSSKASSSSKTQSKSVDLTHSDSTTTHATKSSSLSLHPDEKRSHAKKHEFKQTRPRRDHNHVNSSRHESKQVADSPQQTLANVQENLNQIETILFKKSNSKSLEHENKSKWNELNEQCHSYVDDEKQRAKLNLAKLDVSIKTIEQSVDEDAERSIVTEHSEILRQETSATATSMDTTGQSELFKEVSTEETTLSHIQAKAEPAQQESSGQSQPHAQQQQQQNTNRPTVSNQQREQGGRRSQNQGQRSYRHHDCSGSADNNYNRNNSNSSSNKSNKQKPKYGGNSASGGGGCKPDEQYYRGNYRRDDDDYYGGGGRGSGRGGGGGGASRGYHSQNYHNRNNNNNNNQGGNYYQGNQGGGGGRYYTTSTGTQQNYLVLMNDEDDFNSSAYNDVFIDEDIDEHQSNEHLSNRCHHANVDEQEDGTRTQNASNKYEYDQPLFGKRCEYSILHAFDQTNNKDESTGRSVHNNNEDVETKRGFALRVEHHDAISIEQHDTSIVHNIEQNGTASLDSTSDMGPMDTLDITQPVANRHFMLLTESRSSIRVFPKIRSYSAEVVSINKVPDFDPEMFCDDLNRDSNKFLISSSSSSLNNKNSLDNNNANNDDDSDSYTSCAEDIRNLNDMNCSTRNQFVNEKDILFKNGDIEFTFDAIASSTGTTIQPSLNTGNHFMHERLFDYQRQSVIRHNQHDFEYKKEIDFSEFNKSVCPDKLERLKKFTICIFVDSFEDYSFNRSHESCDSSFNNPTTNMNHNNQQQMSNQFGSNTDLKMFGKGGEFVKSMDYIDHGSSMKHSLSHQDYKSNENVNKNNLNLSRNNFSDYIEIDKSQSLKEFEQTEERITKVAIEQPTANGHSATSIPKTPSSHQLFQATQLTDEEFIFSSYPINYNNVNKSVLASKPPLMPNQHQNHSSHNLNANCLSTITEYSNETFETCSNMSSNRNIANNANNQHSQSCDFDENINQQGTSVANKNHSSGSSSNQTDAYSNESSSTNDFEVDAKNVTYRRGDLRKKNTTTPPGPAHSSHTALTSNKRSTETNSNDTCIAELKSDSVKLREILNDLLNKSSELKPHSQRTVNRSLSNDFNAKLTAERKKSHGSASSFTNEKINLKSRSNSSLSDSCFTSSSSSHNMVQTPSTYSIINRKAQLVAAAAGTPIMNNEHSLTSITRDTQMSALLTDKLFEKFCMISNDDIMNCSDVDKTSMDVLNQHAKNMHNVKIKSKLLEEVLAAPIEEPSMHSDHTQNQHQQQRRASTRNFSKTDNDDGYDDEQEYEDDVFLKSKSIGANQQMKSSTPLVPNELNKLDAGEKMATSVKSTSSLSSSEHNNTLTNQQNNNQHHKGEQWVSSQGPKESTSTTNTTTSKHNNVSSTTTLEISSYTSDSLFNSHLMITPLCSDLTMSPANQLGSFLLKSPLLSPSKNLLNLLPQFNSANTTPQQRKQLQQQIDQIASEFLSKHKSPNQASPSLPLPSPPFLNSNSLSTSLQNSSLPPPPPPLPVSLPTQTTSSTLTAPTSPPLPPPPTMPANAQQQQDYLDSPSLPTPPLLPPLPPSLHNQSKYKFNHNQKPPNSSSFVESLTARFNAIANNEQNKAQSGTGLKKPTVSPPTKMASEMPRLDKGSPQSESSEAKTKSVEDKEPIVTGKPKRSPGKSPTPTNNQSGKKVDTPQHWKEANFNSIFGLDTDDEQQQQQDADDTKYRDRSKSCDLALEHLDKSNSKKAYYQAPVGNRTPVGNYQRGNENIFPNLSTIEYDFDESTLTPEPPNEFKDKEVTPPTKSQMETIEQAKRKSNEARQYVSCPNLINKQLNRVESSTDDDSTKFKLDHLLNINPKRLYKNCKFRCRIHDVIDEQGRFWLEVLYTKDEERKFAEIFKLFRLCARISPPPTDLYENKRVGALYKGDWHRAIVIDQNIYQNGSMTNEKVRVRFIDLGITKMLNPHTELRQVDAKFFNCPPKSLHCSLVVDEEYARDKLKLSKEARKFFTRLIYKKVLFAKIVQFDAKHPTYKIVLGCQTTRGVIDVYMYLLSKFDRTRYCDLKRANHFNQSCRPIDFALIASPHKPHAQSVLSSPNHEYLNVIMPNAPPMSPPQSPPFQTADLSSNQQEFRILNGDNSVMRGFNRDLDNDCGIELNRVVVPVDTNPNGTQSENDSEDEQEEDDDINQIDEDYELNQTDLDNDHFREQIETSEDTDTEDYALFSDIVDTFTQNQMDTFLNVTTQTNNTSHFSTVNESFMDKLPVKDDKKFNYSGSLKIDSVHLPSIHKDNSVSKETTPHKASTNNKNNAKSTAKVVNRNRLVFPNENLTPICIPQLVSKNKPTDTIVNYSSDTDSSMYGKCCTAPLRFKWNSGSSFGLLHKKNKYMPNKSVNNLFNEHLFENAHKSFMSSTALAGTTSNMTTSANQRFVNNNKKVKFHLK